MAAVPWEGRNPLRVGVAIRLCDLELTDLARDVQLYLDRTRCFNEYSRINDLTFAHAVDSVKSYILLIPEPFKANALQVIDVEVYGAPSSIALR